MKMAEKPGHVCPRENTGLTGPCPKLWMMGTYHRIKASGLMKERTLRQSELLKDEEG